MNEQDKNSSSPLALPPDQQPGNEVPKVNYSKEELLYIPSLQARLERSRRLRDVRHDELDGMTFLQHWDLEEKLATTWIPPKLNKEDTNFTSGTIRQKIFALLANFSNLDLTSDIEAYDTDQVKIQGLGQGMQTVIEKTEQMDNDDEKKVMRQYELLKHGYVFVQTLWEERWIMGKKLLQPFEGFLKSAKWKTGIKMLYARPVRDIVAGPNVYLGDITQYDWNKQPYAFTIKYRSYDDAKTIYGDWERWDNVSRSIKPFAPESGTGTSSIVYNTWRLTEVRENYVEELHYEDPIANEQQIILNGVLMLPIGYPLEIEGEMSLTQQNLEPIHPFFAYGKSLVSRLRTGVGILDEMLKLGVLKTQKSFMPARLNLSGKVLSPRIFMPGKITAGISPTDIPTVDQKETEGVTVSELNFIAELQRNIDSNSVSANFQGQQQKSGDITATEVLTLDRQAKLTLGVYIFSMCMLEQKLDWKSLFILLKKWFDPIDEKVDEARKELVKVYRLVNAKKPIPGKGMGRHMIIPTTQGVTPQQVQDAQDHYEKKTGEPHMITVINPDILKQSRQLWELVVTPREKKTSELSKVMFRAFMADIQSPLFVNDLNVAELEEEFASIWNKNPNKLFQKGANAPQPAPGQPAPGGTAGQVPPGGKIPGLAQPAAAKLPAQQTA